MVSVCTHNIDVVVTTIPTITNMAAIDHAIFLIEAYKLRKEVEERRPHHLLLSCFLIASLGLKYESLPNLKTQIYPHAILYVVEQHLDITYK
jgi:hypothetical protein